MRGKKNPMIMGLIGAMLLSTNAFAAVPSDFSDFPTDWSAPAMTRAVQNGLLNGSDGKILPKGLLTRAQMATMVNRAFASSAKASLSRFTDVTPGSWYYDEMAKGVQMGVFQGSGDQLNPNDPITREQAFVVLARAFGLADGSASSLNKFSDADQVSSWAKGAVAALVEQGYVNGADGALNPKSYITRAEFAQVMDALVASYADKDLKDQTVEGNLILRTNSTLENVTVNGDLILSDGVSAANLKNVTVTGRIVVRGGTDGVNLTKTTTKGGIQLANPNGTPKITVDGKAYNPNGTNNGGSTTGGGTSGGGSSSGGSSSGGSSSSGGGSTVTKTDLVVAEQTKLVDLGWSQYVAVRFTDGNSLSNCTLTVDGVDVTSAFSKVTDNGEIAKWEITSLKPAQLVITNTVTGKTQTVKLSDNTNPTAPTVSTTSTAPSYMVAHGPLAYWDYFLTNYDKDGNVRIDPAKTTFSLSGVEETDVPAYYSPNAELSGSGMLDPTGEVVIMFNYNSTEDKAWFDAVAENAAHTVQLVSYNDNKTTINDNLTYTKVSDVDHFGGKVGEIKIALGQSNFTSNGRYYVRIASAGHDTALVPIHVVNKEEPVLKLSGSGTITSGSNVTFKIENMVYGITNPTYAAELTRPDGKTVSLEMITDWYQIGDSLFLYNTTNEEGVGQNNIPYNGTYTLTVHSNGFKDMSATFKVTGGEDVPTANTAKGMRSIDARSSATSGGSGSSSGEGGGGYAISADLKFDADLLINAKILNNLGIVNEAAIGINDRWEYDMAGYDVVCTTEGAAYDWSDYITAVSNSETNEGVYLTFADYIKTANTKNYTPHAVKSVLEDNLLGDIQSNGSWLGLTPPTLKLVDSEGNELDAVIEDNDVILTTTDAEYFAKLTAINVNGNSVNLSTEKYTVSEDGLTLTIDKSTLTLGQRNTIVLYANGYKANTLSISYQKDLEQNLSLMTDKQQYQNKENVVITVVNSNGDFLKNLSGVTVNKPDGTTTKVWTKGYYSSTEYITVDGNTLTIYDTNGNIFSANGSYTVELTATYYNQLTTEAFEVSVPTDQAVPNDEPDVSVDYYGSYELKFDKSASNWLKAIGNIKVNDQEYTLQDGWSYSLGEKEYKVSGYSVTLGKGAFTKDVNEVVISADGYGDLVLSVGKDGTLIITGETQSAPEVKRIETVEADYITPKYYKVTLESNTLQKYFKRITRADASLTVNGTAYTRGVTGVYGDKSFSIFNNTLDITTDSFTKDQNTVVVTVPGYDTLTFIVDKNGKLVNGDNSGENPGGSEVAAPTQAPAIQSTQATSGSYNNYYALVFQKNDSAWVNSITDVSVNGTSYVKRNSAGDLSYSQNYFLDAEHSIVGITLSSGTYEVVFSVNGKTSLTLEISAPFLGTPSVTIKSTETPGSGENGGSTGGSETPGSGEVTAPTQASIEKKQDYTSWNYYYALTFGSEYSDWVADISGVKVNGKDYTVVENTGSVALGKYCLNTDEGVVALYLNPDMSGDEITVVLSMNNVETMTLKITFPSFMSSDSPSVEIQ